MGKTQNFDWGFIDWIYDSQDMNSPNNLHVGISSILPGRRQKEHIHYGDEQVLYVLSGRGEQIIDKTRSIKEKGSYYYIPAGSVHETINNGDEPIVELIISVPVKDTLLNNIESEVNLKFTEDFTKKVLTLTPEMEDLYKESSKSLNIPLVVLDKNNDPIRLPDEYPQFCKKNCRIHEDLGNCKQYYINDGYVPPQYKDPFAFVCPWNLRIFVWPIIIQGRLIGYVKGGQFRTPEEDENIDPKLLEDQDYNSMEVFHRGRLTAILENAITLSKNIGYLYILENSNEVIGEKEEIISSISKNEIILKENLKKTKEEVLQIQLNQHFLFNTLNAIAGLAIKEDSPKVYDSIIRLSSIFRYSLREQGRLVDFQEELDFIYNYLELQRLRYGERVKLNFNIQEKTRRLKVPFNFLQPLIENIFTHGITPDTGEFSIDLSAIYLDDYLYIKLKDRGEGIRSNQLYKLNSSILSGESDSRLSGLLMIGKKLNYYYNTDWEFRLGNHPEGGLLINIEIPVKVGEDV